MKTRLPLILAVTLVLTGIGASAYGGAATTPQQAVMNLRDAVVKNDESAFLACFDATDVEKTLLRALFGFTQALKKFDEKTKAAFGEEAAAGLRDNGQSDPFGELAKVTKDDLIIEAEGDMATCRLKGKEEGAPMPLVRKNGVWLAKFDNKGAPPEEEVKKAVKMMEAMAKVMSDMADRAGAEGMTPEALKEEMAAKMMAVIMSMMAEMEGQPPASAPADQPSTQPSE